MSETTAPIQCCSVCRGMFAPPMLVDNVCAACWKEQAEQAEKERDEARRYLAHKPACEAAKWKNWPQKRGGKCTCGLSALLAELEKEKGKDE